MLLARKDPLPLGNACHDYNSNICSRQMNYICIPLLIDWCSTPTLAVFQLYHGIDYVAM